MLSINAGTKDVHMANNLKVAARINCGTAGSYGVLQIVRPATQPDANHFISCVRQGSAIFGIGFHAGGANKMCIANSGTNSPTTGITIDTNKIGMNNRNPSQALDVVGQILCGSLKGGQGNSAGNFHVDQHAYAGHLYLNYYSTGFVFIGNTYYTLFDTSNGTHKQVLKFASGTTSRVLWDFFKNNYVQCSTITTIIDRLYYNNNTRSYQYQYLKKLTPAGQTMAIGALIYNGSSVGIAQVSDIRLEENINPIKNHFEILDKLNPVNFAYKENPSKLIDVFIADELYDSYECATYGEPGELKEDGTPKMMMIDTKPLIPILTKCIQGNRKQIQDLERKQSK